MDIKQYETSFVKSIKKLAGAEQVTKAVLIELSRSILQVTQVTEDVGYMNRLLGALTPVNRKVAVLFFKEFSGFTYTEESLGFTKKDKKQYEAKKQAAITFLEDPLNNIWTWAGRNVDIEPKAFELDKVKSTFETLIKKAEKAGYSQKDVLKQVFAAGVDVETVLALLDEVYQLEAKVE